MARKSIKGYAEKNYYDNTRFNGGIIATHDPLNEGYFKHLVNFDISDMGQSIKPRKGFLTTTITGYEYNSDMSLEFDIAYDDGYEHFFDISIVHNDRNFVRDLCDNYKYCTASNVDAIVLLSHSGESWKYNIQYTVDILQEYILFTLKNCTSTIGAPNLPDVFRYFTISNANGGIINVNYLILQNYTVDFSLGSINISFSNALHTPRLLSSNVIYYYDENLGEYIFVDFTQVNAGTIPAWRVKFGIDDNFIKSCKHISNVDTSDIDLYNINNDRHFDITQIKPIYTNQALRVEDEHMITSYVIKVTDNTDSLWLKLYYRPNKVTDDNNPNTEDSANTLVVSYLDFDDIVNYVDTTNRNLASFDTVIPNPMQELYNETSTVPIGHIDRLPMIYIKKDDKYLVNTFQELEGSELIPNFYLNNSDTEYSWAYTYDIYATVKDSVFTESKVYKAPIYYVQTNQTVPHTYTDTLTEIIQHQKDVYKSSAISQGVSTTASYITYMKSLYRDLKDNYIDESPNEYIIYLVPYVWSTISDIPDYSNRRSLESYYINLNSSSTKGLFGPYGIYSHFCPNKVYTETSYSAPLSEEHNVLADRRHLFGDKYTWYINKSLPLENPTLYSFLWGINDNTQAYVKSYVHEDGYHKASLYGIIIKRLPTGSYFNKDLTTSKQYFDCVETCLMSDIYIHHHGDDTEVIPLSSFLESPHYASLRNALTTSSKVVCKIMYSVSHVHFTNVTEDAKSKLTQIFPNLSTSNSYYTIYTTLKTPPTYDRLVHANANSFYMNVQTLYNKLFFLDHEGITMYPLLKYDNKTIRDQIIYSHVEYVDTDGDGDTDKSVYVKIEQQSIFTKNNNNDLIINFNKEENLIYTKLDSAGYFKHGLLINFYLIRVMSHDQMTKLDDYIPRSQFIASTSLNVGRQLTKHTDNPTTYIERLEEEPTLIHNAKNHLVFNSSLGDHLVIYTNNKVFISKEGMPYYFTQDYMKSFPEPIVKVIQYKDMLLVFSTQNLYAIYLYEDITYITEMDAEGNVQNVQQKVLQWASLPVLYNLLVNEKYKDAIQVYNQMVLFYSSDGQMFLIKPTAAIDSNTRFSIQYFNKSANDILLNYKDYMQERLVAYGIDKTITDVEIKVSASINYIKIFYSAPGIMTYILVYDVLNNRYYTYDTLSFNKIKSLHYVPEGEMYITEYLDSENNSNLYFTLPYDNKNYVINTEDTIPDDVLNNLNNIDNNVDRAFYDRFSPMPINCEIDTGTINLNNHLKKRFKDLHVIYKNLNANDIEFKIETFVDDVPIITYVDTNIEVRDISDRSVLITTDTNKVTQLVDNISLFNFTDYSSNKIITHKTNIVSKGKTIRVKMNFSSKGKYKIQGFGLIYKEHTV